MERPSGVDARIPLGCDNTIKACWRSTRVSSGCWMHWKRPASGENTLIIFTSDQGFAWGQHGFRHKVAAYDANIRSPLIFSMPGADPTWNGCVTSGRWCRYRPDDFQVRGHPSTVEDARTRPISLVGESVGRLAISGADAGDWSKSTVPIPTCFPKAETRSMAKSPGTSCCVKVNINTSAL